MRVTVDVFGDTVIDRKLLRFGERAGDLTAAWAEVMRYLEEQEARQFETEGHWLSGGWEPLAASTKARKSAGSTILVETGALKESLTSAGAEGAIRDVRPDGIDFGTTVPYAGFHQRGTRNMPKRPLLELPERAKRDVVGILHRHVFEGL